MSRAPHNRAALALLNAASLSEKEGGFLGGMAFRIEPPTERQERWLRILLDRWGLPHLDDQLAWQTEGHA